MWNWKTIAEFLNSGGMNVFLKRNPAPEYCPGTGLPPKVVVLYPERDKKIDTRVCSGCDRATVEVVDNVVLAHMKVT